MHDKKTLKKIYNYLSDVKVKSYDDFKKNAVFRHGNALPREAYFYSQINILCISGRNGQYTIYSGRQKIYIFLKIMVDFTYHALHTMQKKIYILMRLIWRHKQ